MINNAQPKNHTKVILITLLATAAFFFMAMYFMVLKPLQQSHHLQDVKIDGVVLPKGQVVSGFNFTDTHGSAFTKEELKGHWTMMFFGFTNCGMVCPTTMAELNQMYKTLQRELPDNKLPKIVMISVDPDRDSIERMNEYVTTFNTNFIGARAEIAETVALEKQLHIAAAKIEADGEGNNHYTINHTADILLVNPNGEVQAFMSFPHKAAQMVKDYKLVLTAFNS